MLDSANLDVAERRHPRPPLRVRILLAQPDHREVSDREREHRAERVDRRQERRLARKHDQDRDCREDEDRDVGSPELRVDLSQPLGKLAVLAHRVGEPREPDQRGVGGDQQDHGGEDPDVDPEHLRQPDAEADVLDDPEHRVVGEGRAELGRELAVRPLGHRHRRQRDDRQQRVEADHREHDQPDAARDRLRGVLAPPRPCSRSSRSRCRRPSRPRSRAGSRPRSAPTPSSTWSTSSSGLRTSTIPISTSSDLREEVRDREHEVQPRRLLGALDVERREQADQDDRADHVRRALPQRLPEDREVVRHEEGRDRDRDDVGEHLAPSRDEAERAR